MPEEPATEFEAIIEYGSTGEWEWKIEPLNGRWPYWLSGRDSLTTAGTCWTRWGARREARHALRVIRKYLNRSEPERIRDQEGDGDG